MSTKLKSVVSLVAGMAMLMSVGVGTAMTAGAAEAQTPLVQLVEEDGGTTVLDKDTLTDGAGTPWKSMYLVFEKELNSYASADDCVAAMGEFITVNGATLKNGFTGMGGFGRAISPYTVDFLSADNDPKMNAKTLRLDTNRNEWADHYIEGGNTGLTISPRPQSDDSKVNEVKILKGFPLKDGPLDRTITITSSKATENKWVVDDPGSQDVVTDPNEGKPLEISMGTFEVDGKEYPVLPAAVQVPYGAVKIQFSRPLYCGTSQEEILEAVGERILTKGHTLTSLYKDSDAQGIPGKTLMFDLSADKRTLVIYARWDTIGGSDGGFYYYVDDKGAVTTAEIELTFRKGLAYGLTGEEKLDADYRAVWDKEKWTIVDPNAEPDLDGVKVTVNMTDADGGPGITDAKSGESWTSVARIVFSAPLTVEDISPDALMAQFGKYVTINTGTADKAYQLNNAGGTGVQHAISFGISADRTALIVYSDVTMANAGALLVDRDNFVIVSKDFPITSKKTLERDVAFEYAKDTGAWTVIDPYTGDDTSSDSSSSDPASTPEESGGDSSTDEIPVTGVAAPVAAVAVLAAACGAIVLTARRKRS